MVIEIPSNFREDIEMGRAVVISCRCGSFTLEKPTFVEHCIKKDLKWICPNCGLMHYYKSMRY